MVNEQKLIDKLRKIESNKYLLEKSEKAFELGLDMIDNIGSLNPVLRDNLIYGTFFHWIPDKIFKFEELKIFLDITLDQKHLFYRIEEDDENGVFKRSFSVLIVALILSEHRKYCFLSKEKLQEVKMKIIEYMSKEKDVRGYVEMIGWAHSAAHTADALDELAKCSSLNKEDLMDILNSIKSKVSIGYYAYIDEESERMVTAVESVINRNELSDLEIITWINGFNLKDDKCRYIENYHMKVNIKAFLRSLYFRILEDESRKMIIEEIVKVLKKLK